jgi:predicted nucleic acid-binding protein
MSLICADNHLLIWGVRNVATTGQEVMIAKAVRYISFVDEQKDDILVPSVVLAEFLAGVPEERSAAVLAVMEKRFKIAPFDTPAAVIAARIWRKVKSENASLLDDLRQDGVSRIKIKADIQIIATAVARKADRIISHDAGLQKLAEGWIEAVPIPDIPTQGSLFEEGQ